MKAELALLVRLVSRGAQTVATVLACFLCDTGLRGVMMRNQEPDKLR